MNCDKFTGYADKSVQLVPFGALSGSVTYLSLSLSISCVHEPNVNVFVCMCVFINIVMANEARWINVAGG